MAASLTKTQSYTPHEWEVQTTATALTVTLVADDYLWIRQTLSTDDPGVTPTLSLMEIEAISVATPINLQGTPGKYQIEWTWQEGSL